MDFYNYIYCLRTMPHFPNVRNVGDRIAFSCIDRWRSNFPFV